MTPIDLATALPSLIPGAVAWAEACASDSNRAARSLDFDEVAIARHVGVQQPERIRLMEVDELPMPTDPMLRHAAHQTGFLAGSTIGLTLGYAIFIRIGHLTSRLLSHECRHVHQYEVAGSIARFLPTYLQQIVQYGYHAAPLEADARMHEVTART